MHLDEEQQDGGNEDKDRRHGEDKLRVKGKTDILPSQETPQTPRPFMKDEEAEAPKDDQEHDRDVHDDVVPV
jgi:hypothetical protein